MKLAYESISIELTKRCNLECKYCYSRTNKEDEKYELSTQQLIDFMKRFKESNGRRVLLTGGEALLRPDFKKLVLAAKGLGLIVDLFTNGTLMTDDMAKFISENINLVNMSLDGPRSYHDKIRCGVGSFDKTNIAMAYLDKYKAHYALQCMVTSENYNELDWLKDIFSRFHPIMIKLGHVSKMGRGKDRKELWLTYDQQKYLKKLAGEIAENCNNFHTRIITNIISEDEFDMFYPTLDNVLAHWLLPNGRIMSCYVYGSLDKWTISSHQDYPICNDEVYKRTRILEEQLYEAAKKTEVFDLLELTEKIASTIQ